MRRTIFLLFFAAALICSSPARAQLLATDDFESYTNNPVGQPGGAGDWTAPWGYNSQAGGGTFRSTASTIDGVQSIGLFGDGSTAGRSISRPFPDCTSNLTIGFSTRGDFNVNGTGNPTNLRRMAFTVRAGNGASHFDNQRLSFFFAAGSTNFQWYDGVNRATNAVNFTTTHVYIVRATLNPADRSYTFTASNRNNGTWFTYAGTWSLGANGEAMGSVAYMMRGPSGEGNDAFLDSVTVSSPTFVPVVAGPSIREGDAWKYFKGTSTPAVQGTTTWSALTYDDSAWLGPSPSGFGYDDCDDGTTLGDMLNGYLSVFTRKAFTVGDTSTIARLTLGADYDDGLVAYLNGVEVARLNMPGGAIAHTTAASGNHEASRGNGSGNPQEKQFVAVDPGLLLNGTNVLAVSGHNVSLGSSDFSLVIELHTNASLVRGPFIQMPEDDRVTVAWRTAALTDSAVDYGLDLSYGGGTVSDATLTRDHTIHIPGLLPGTAYYYRVRSGGETLSEGSVFRTKPETNQAFRFVVIGDHGQGTDGMRNIAARINAREDFEAIMTVGDNIYGGGGCNFDGGPGWYDPFWFALYEPTMRRVSTFPALGNHDWDTASGQWMVDYFRLPTNGPASQIGKNYSFRLGNIHFVVIDTEPFDDNNAPAMSAITNWLAGDLASATQPWRMALLHRPPYTTVGGHGDHAAVKAQIVPILKAGGVQVVFQGHNHWYERINPIDGVNYITSGSAGAGLYTFTARKEYSAVLYRDRHSYTMVDIDGSKLALQQFNDLDELVDEFHVDIGHAFAIDGLVDDWSWLRAQNGLKLFAAIRGNHLYVATQDAGEGNDHFIYVADALSTQRPANWAKSGTIMQWGAFLADENDNAFFSWYGANEQALSDPQAYRATTSGLNNNAPNTNGVLEGSIDLATHFGAFPQQLYLAAAPYGNAAGETLTHVAQVPAGNGDGDIQSGEFLAFNARDLALDLPVADAGTNASAEAGMWVSLDGSQSAAPSGLPLSCAWSQLSGPAGVFAAADSAFAAFRLTNNVGASTSVVLQLTVNDTRFDSNDTVHVTFVPMLDSDADGLSDQEELTGLDNALTFADPQGAASDPNDSDSDDDGMSDGHEAIAGTDRNNAASLFKVVDSAAASATNLVLRWSSVSGKLYAIHSTTNLLAHLEPVQTDIPAAAPVNSFTVTVDGIERTFYVIEVQP